MLNRLPYNSNGYNQQLFLCKKYAVDLLNYKFYSYGIPYKLGWCGNIFTEVEKELKAPQNIDKQPKTEINRMEKWLNSRTVYMDNIVKGYPAGL